MRIGLVSIGASLALWAAPALADEPRSVPIHMSDSGHILTDVTINGAGPYTFIVDTAAGATVVFDEFAQSAGLAPVEGHDPIQVQGASGIVEARLVRVGNVEAGEWAFTLDTAIALPGPPHITDAVGVLGVNALFAQPVGFALGEGEIQIYEERVSIRDSQVLNDNWFAVPIDRRLPQAPFYWTTVIVDGVPIDAVIDTGARRTTINSAGVRALGIDPDTAALAEADPIRGATDDATPAYSLPVATLQLGERVWGSRLLTLADLPLFDRMGRGDTPTIVFGADFLTEQNFIIDPVEDVLWVMKRQSAALGFLLRPTSEVSAANR